jgi:hypothetical protein
MGANYDFLVDSLQPAKNLPSIGGAGLGATCKAGVCVVDLATPEGRK